MQIKMEIKPADCDWRVHWDGSSGAILKKERGIIIKAVVFDFDGLILDTETVWFHCYKEALSNYNINLTLEVFGQCIGTWDDSFFQFIEEKAGENAVKEVTEHVHRLHAEKIAVVEAREGVKEYLEEAKGLGLKIGLASSSNREWIHRFLKKLGFMGYFDVIKTSDNVTKIKPDPELYQKAVEALGVRPDEAIAFEDSHNGSTAAKAAGLACVIFPNPVTEGLEFKHYDLRLRSMADRPLSELLKQFNHESTSSEV